MQSLKSRTRLLYLFVFLSTALVRCDDDLPVAEGLGPSLVSAGIEIESGTRQSGDLPEATPGSQSPVIEERNDTLYLIAATYTNVFVEVLSGDVAGFNVKVKGSNDHFRIASANAFKEYSPSGSVGFAITVDENMPAGQFTLQYNVYDGDNRFSNVVERQVVISGAPGKGSEFLSGTEWATVREVWGTGDIAHTITMGVAEEHEFTSLLDCVSQPDKPVTWTQKTRYDYKHYTFSPDGAFYLEIDDYFQTLDHTASKASCSMEYSVNDKIDNYEGLWSYYAETRRLIIRYKMVGIANVSRREYTVNASNETLTWTAVNVVVPVKHTLIPL